MNAIKNIKSSKIKLISTPKIKQNIIHNSKSKRELRTKINYIIKEENKNLFIKVDQNNNLTPIENKKNHQNNYLLDYDINSNAENNNILPNEKSTKTDDSSGEEKVMRKIQVHTPLNLTDKFKNSKTLSNKKMNKYTLTLSLMNYISNKANATNNISKLIKESTESKRGIIKNEVKKAIYYKDYNKKKEQKKYLDQQSLTECNFTKQNKSCKNSDNNNLYTQHYNNFNAINNNKKAFIKNKSYDCLKRITLNNVEKKMNKVPKTQSNNQNINKEKTEECHYIKVNKKTINNNSNNNENILSQNKNEKINANKIFPYKNYNMNKKTNRIKNKIIVTRNKIIKHKISNIDSNTNTNNKLYNTEISNKKTKSRMAPLKKIEKTNIKYNMNILSNKSEEIKQKTKKLFDKNKLEHNIFLDKTYQNRFKKNQKNKNKIHNDIFTSDKQKEYNDFIVKKKSNYLSNQIINSNNSSSSSNESNKDWVYRLYNKEIKKQKIKDKIILLLRKSILNEEKANNKQLSKSKTLKQFKNYRYPINDGYNIDDNFNIINLFLSDDKKLRKKNKLGKKKKIKKCQSFHTYRNKNRRYSFDDNKIEDEKIGKLIEDKINLKNHRSYKKFRLLYNEELIDEEDEEKEKDEEE